MSQVRAQVRGGGRDLGGIRGYPLERLYEEVAFIAYHFHWSHEEIIQMDHQARQRWVEEISKINRQLSGDRQRSILEIT